VRWQVETLCGEPIGTEIQAVILIKRKTTMILDTYYFKCAKCGDDVCAINPNVTICSDCANPKKRDSQNIVIQHAEVNVNSVNVQENKTPKLISLKEFIGQEDSKASINTAIKIIKQVRPINIFMSSRPGMGKSTLSELVAKELDAEYIYTIPEQLLNVDKISEVLNRIQASNKLVCWCIDECHLMSKHLINILLPILQDHRLGDVIIKDFVLILATTDYNKLYKKSEALISRCQIKINLEKYTINNLVTIIKQYRQKLNIDINIPEKDYELIALNSKGCPRNAINMLLKRLVVYNMDEIFKENKIVGNGLNNIDIEILKYLNINSTAIGANFLSQKVGLLEDDYLKIYEPYLVECGYIDRNKSGRFITEKGKGILK
jgi:Holliday junction DNA helicase RuvB